MRQAPSIFKFTSNTISLFDGTIATATNIHNILNMVYTNASFTAWSKFYDEYRIVKVTAKI